MDLQGYLDRMIELSAKERGKYHLSYGELIKALKAAPPDAVFDERIKGIGSWRGSYTEIALYTKREGFHAEKEKFNGYGGNRDDFHERYKTWKESNIVEADELPRNAHKLAEVLESLLGLGFVGYKGGNFTIEEYKPLWLEEDYSTYSNIAIVGIDKDLKLITKELEEDNA